MQEKSTKWLAKIVIGIVFVGILYGIYLLYWKMYFVGK